VTAQAWWLSECNALCDVSTAWALAAAKFWDENIFVALGRVAEPQVNGFRVQNVASTALALATAKLLDDKIFAAPARAAELRLIGSRCMSSALRHGHMQRQSFEMRSCSQHKRVA